MLEVYNSQIKDQKARLLIAKERRGTMDEGSYDSEMVVEGERRIREWKLKRDEEVLDAWEGIVQRWRGVRIQRDKHAKGEKEGRMRLWINGVEQNWGSW